MALYAILFMFQDTLLLTAYAITAEDNLKLLENVHEEILILPLRLLNQSNDHNSLYKVGEQIFVSLFNDINNLDEYFSKCESIDNIIYFARNDIEKLVVFSESDDSALSFKERYQIELKKTQYMLDNTKPDSYNFFMLVFGCIQQAIDVIVSCIEYGCIPYIRYPVSLHYISLLSNSILDIEDVATLRFKMHVAFAVYQLCDKDKLANVSLKRYLIENQQYNFNRRLFQSLTDNGIDANTFSSHLIAPLILKELQLWYDHLNKISE